MISYLHESHLGSARFISSSTGSQVFSSNYVPYGPQYGASGTPDEFLYAGKIYDGSTGFYYFGARYYDPTIGRFVTPDSVSGAGDDPQNLNRYIYARDNPMKITDPNGHDWWSSLTSALSNAASSISSAISTATSAATNALSSIPPLVQSVGNQVVSSVSSIATPIASSLSDAGQRAAQRAQTMVSQATTALSVAVSCLSGVCGAWGVTAGLAIATVGVGILTYRASETTPVSGFLSRASGRFGPGAYGAPFGPTSILAGATYKSAMYNLQAGPKATPYEAYQASGLSAYVDSALDFFNRLSNPVRTGTLLPPLGRVSLAQ